MKDAFIILLASGTGKRFGQGGTVPKQLTLVKRRPLLWYSVIRALELVPPGRIVLTVPPGMHERFSAMAGRWHRDIVLVEGGDRRQDSVRNAVSLIEKRKGVVLIHDSARPLASAGLYRRVYREARIHGAAIPVIPSPDTVKELAGGRVVRTIDRSTLGMAQTPQGFRIELLSQAFKETDFGREYTDEAGLLESLGRTVRTVPGERHNFKLTFEEDLAIIKALIHGTENGTRN